MRCCARCGGYPSGSAKGRSLAASRLALSLNWDGGADSRRFSHGRAVNNIDTFGALLTPDGSKIVCATDTETERPRTAELAFTEFSARTGQVVAVLSRWLLTDAWPAQVQDVLWASADGSTLLVVAHRPGAPPSPAPHSPVSDFRIQFGVLHGNQYTPLPGAPGPNQVNAWPVW